MKVLLDADSLIFASCINAESLEDAISNFNSKLESVIDDLSEFCDADDVVVCSGGDNSLRTSINESYKANRKNRPELLTDVHKEVKLSYDSVSKKGYETDDVVASLWKKEVDLNGEDSVIIAANDKDYKQLPCWYFDTYYSRRTLDKIEELEALKNFYTQMIVGDSADNINYIKGKGKAFAKNLFKGIRTHFGLFRATYIVFLKEYDTEAKNKFKECYSLLKLRTDIYD
jgi:5'-3' exonuclease